MRGNHEQSFIHHLKNDSSPSVSFEKLKRDMGDQVGFWKNWLESLPLFYFEGKQNEKNSFLVVHAGVAPDFPPHETEPHILTNIRSWDPINNKPGDVHHPPWYDFYKESRMIIFGHWAVRGIVVRKNVIGLDSGCVYGRYLTALSWPEKTLYQYPAKKIYHYPQL